MVEAEEAEGEGSPHRSTPGTQEGAVEDTHRVEGSRRVEGNHRVERKAEEGTAEELRRVEGKAVSTLKPNQAKLTTVIVSSLAHKNRQMKESKPTWRWVGFLRRNLLVAHSDGFAALGASRMGLVQEAGEDGDGGSI
ncbi:hypothetical protein BHE74_00035725 [Ensete ventricosum]|nr:hypothetical protein BHE74_00035725 [Ensete ventricosum]